MMKAATDNGEGRTVAQEQDLALLWLGKEQTPSPGCRPTQPTELSQLQRSQRDKFPGGLCLANGMKMYMGMCVADPVLSSPYHYNFSESIIMEIIIVMGK